MLVVIAGFAASIVSQESIHTCYNISVIVEHPDSASNSRQSRKTRHSHSLLPDYLFWQCDCLPWHPTASLMYFRWTCTHFCKCMCGHQYRPAQPGSLSLQYTVGVSPLMQGFAIHAFTSATTMSHLGMMGYGATAHVCSTAYLCSQCLSCKCMHQTCRTGATQCAIVS
jgi:hypothetical protein